MRKGYETVQKTAPKLPVATLLRQQKEKCPFFGHFSNVLAPQVRLELTTLRLTAECSAIELLRNVASDIITVRSEKRKG